MSRGFAKNIRFRLVLYNMYRHEGRFDVQENDKICILLFDPRFDPVWNK